MKLRRSAVAFAKAVAVKSALLTCETRHMKRVALLVAVGVLAIPVSVLGYGYWFRVTHGALLLDVIDASDREHPRALWPFELALLNSEGRTLAEARSVGPSGVAYVSSPAAYSCWEVERRAPFSVEARNEWDKCFARQSRWIPTWVRSLKYIDLRSGPCSIRKIPVSVSEYSGTLWLWWVPHPHIGGKPYTSFSASIRVDRNRCALSG